MAAVPQLLLSGRVLQLFVCVGILLAFGIGLPYDGEEAMVHLLGKETAWWRVMFAFGLVPAIMQVCVLALAAGCLTSLGSLTHWTTAFCSSLAQAVGMSFCPESPVWLEWKGKTEDAWRARGQLQGQVASALPQISNLGATHFSDVEKHDTAAFAEEAEGVAEPLRPSEEGAVLSEAESSYLVCLLSSCTMRLLAAWSQKTPGPIAQFPSGSGFVVKSSMSC